VAANNIFRRPTRFEVGTIFLNINGEYMADATLGMYVWIAGFPSTEANFFVGTDKHVGTKKIRPIVHRLNVDASDVQAKAKAKAKAITTGPKKNSIYLQGRSPGVHVYGGDKDFFEGYGINARFLGPDYTLDLAEQWIKEPPGQEFSKGASWTMLVYKQFDDDPDGMPIKLTGKRNDER
jgi:hypothetical protein